MMVEFTKTTLGDCISTIIDYRGKTPKKLGGDWANEGYRAFSAKNIKTGQIVNPESIRYIDENLYKSWMKEEIKRGDIIITSEAPFGEIYYWDSDEKIVLSQRLFAIRCAVGYYSKFIYYSMASPSFQSELKNRATGTTVFGLRQPELLKCELEVPDYPTQVKIAAILSSLDDKIELNTRMNNVLEEIARALFRRWFVAFEFPDNEGKPYKSAGGKMVESEMGRVPEGWRVGTIGEIANITMGQSPSGDSYNEEGKGEVFYQGRAEFGSRFPTRRLFTTEPKRMAEKGAVLMSVRAPVGDLNIATEKCCIGRGVAAIQSIDNHPSFILYTMINLKRELNVFNGEGTVFGSINKASLHAMQILIPSENIIDRFEKMVSPLDVMIENNYNEAQRLTGIRDGLLPKLMNGELSI